MVIAKEEIKYLLVLTILFLTVSTLVYAQFGIQNVIDSHRFLNYASNLEDGFYIENHNFWYIGYVVFIYAVRIITDSHSELNLIITQFLYSFLGLIFLYKTIKIFDAAASSAFIGGLLYIVLIEISIWNTYILCESFYFNTIVITIYLLGKTIILNKYNLINIVLTTCFIVLTILTKPTGIALLLSLGITGYSIFWINSKTSKFIKITTLVVGCTLLGLLLNKMLEIFLIIENYQTGEVVYAISTLHQKVQYDNLKIPVPTDLNILSNDYPSVIRLFHFVLSNFGYWCTLFFKKLFYFLFHVRPYWSLKHNIFNLAVVLPTYIFAIRQIILSEKIIKYFAITYIGLHALIVGITTVDWDGRFFLPLLPILIIFSAQGINRLKISLKPNKLNELV